MTQQKSMQLPHPDIHVLGRLGDVHIEQRPLQGLPHVFLKPKQRAVQKRRILWETVLHTVISNMHVSNAIVIVVSTFENCFQKSPSTNGVPIVIVKKKVIRLC